MKKIINGCIDCDIPCTDCELKRIEYHSCDCCKKEIENDIITISGRNLCSKCYENYFDKIRN